MDVLMDCHERELLKLDPYEASMIPSVAGLVRRGLVTTHTYITKNGKKIYALFITGEGINIYKTFYNLCVRIKPCRNVGLFCEWLKAFEP